MRASELTFIDEREVREKAAEEEQSSQPLANPRPPPSLEQNREWEAGRRRLERKRRRRGKEKDTRGVEWRIRGD